MKPVQQVFALVLEHQGFQEKGHTIRKWHKELDQLRKEFPDIEKQNRKKMPEKQGSKGKIAV